MLSSYQAVLHEDHISWRGEKPPELVPGQDLIVEVTVLPEALQRQTASSDGSGMAQALEELASSSTSVPADASAWEREARADRALPGQEP
jgi:hypothetical protein